MLKFATIGSGWITDEYIHGAKDSGLWELAAVYSRDPARGREYAQKHGAKLVFTDLRELAQSSEIDAVYVASPNAAHYEQCKALLLGGKHVICEKPLCAQAWKVKELVKLAEEKGLVFLEAIMFLHQPQLKKLENAMDQIGNITMAKFDFCQRSSKLDAYQRGELPNIFNPQLETGALMDLGVYCVYPVLHLFGTPISYRVERTLLESGADANGALILTYPDGLITLTYSKISQAGANSDIQGDRGTITLDSISKLNGMALHRRDGTVEPLHGEDEKYKLMGNEAKDFYRYITQPEASRQEYANCSRLSVEVAEFLEDVRQRSGIAFPSDQET
ncbi:MAG: Gfo/Idh/MocA family oxidoreductase [Acutalibacter sp.]|nr:Gfo/Idh/MocA family oxidoreductase [Acutalibacter sp.]